MENDLNQFVFLIAMKYICTICGNKIEIKEGKNLPRVCPYCGEETAFSRLLSAKELIDDA